MRNNAEVEVGDYQIDTTNHLILTMKTRNQLFYMRIHVLIYLQRSWEWILSKIKNSNPLNNYTGTKLTQRLIQRIWKMEILSLEKYGNHNK